MGVLSLLWYVRSQERKKKKSRNRNPAKGEDFMNIDSPGISFRR